MDRLLSSGQCYLTVELEGAKEKGGMGVTKKEERGKWPAQSENKER